MKETREERANRWQSPLVSRPVKITKTAEGVMLSGLPDREIHHVFADKPMGWQEGQPVPADYVPFKAITPKPIFMAAVQVRVPFRFVDHKGVLNECDGGDYLIQRSDGHLTFMRRFDFEEAFTFLQSGVRQKPTPADADERMERIVACMMAMPTKEAAGDTWRTYYKTNGTPDALYLTSYLGFQVSGDERDEAWAKVQAQRQAMSTDEKAVPPAAAAPAFHERHPNVKETAWKEPFPDNAAWTAALEAAGFKGPDSDFLSIGYSLADDEKPDSASFDRYRSQALANLSAAAEGREIVAVAYAFCTYEAEQKAFVACCKFAPLTAAAPADAPDPAPQAEKAPDTARKARGRGKKPA